jgi:hypothetical protein
MINASPIGSKRNANAQIAVYTWFLPKTFQLLVDETEKAERNERC